MSALDADRNTPEMVILPNLATLRYPLTDTVIAYQGGIAVLDSSGEMKPGVTATGLIAVGRFEKTVDNTDDGEYGYAKPGVFRMANGTGADEITAAEIGDVCYIDDDQTVAKTDASTTRSVAGVIVSVDSDGVWVAVGFALFAQPSPTPGGPFLLSKTVTIDELDLIDGDDGDAEDHNIGTALPDGAVLIAARYKINEVFAGVGVASLTMIVGFSGDTNGVIEAVDIFGDATGEYRGVPGTAMGGPAGGKQLVANFDPDASAGLDELSAGNITIEVFYVVVPYT